MACLVVESPTQCSPLQIPYRPENSSLIENWYGKEGLQGDSGYDSVLKVVEVEDSTCILNDASSETRVERGNKTGTSCQDPEDVCTINSGIKDDQLGFVKDKIEQEHEDLIPVYEDVADHHKEQIFKELTIPLVKLRVVRNPLHKKLELEEDEYIFCNQCDKLCIGECGQHRVLKWLKVTPVVMKREGVSIARCTLLCSLELKESSIPDAGLGIFAKERFDSDTVFGPYGGKKISVGQVALNMDQSYMWDIIENGRVTHVVDARDEEHSNWLRFVNCARNEGEQNLVAFQYRGDIYYRSYKIIEPGNELLVWYGDRYACDLDILKGHMATQPADGPVQCQKCFMWCPGPASLASHNKFRCQMNSEHHRWRCMHCDKSFKSYQQLNIHKNIHKGLKPYVCKICNKAFICPSYRRKHYSIHLDGQSCQCEKCGKVFRTRSYLRKHEKDFHGDNKEVKCPRCWKKCSGDRALRLHLRRCYSNEKSLRCIQCHKQYATRKSLKMHRQSIHSGDVFNCKTCGKMFQKKENLLKHESLHGNGMNQIRGTHLKCAPCKMTFATIGHLRKHQEARHSEVAFNCKTCGKLFQKKENLFKHESLHKNGTRSIRGTKLECESCQKTFATVGHLRQHMKARHSVDDIEKTCGKLFQKEKLLKQESLDNNVTSQIRESRLECVPCGKTFATIGYLRKHRKAKHSVDVFDCKTWGKLFQKKENLLKHESLHGNGMNQIRGTHLKCAPCKMTFATIGHLRKHQEARHSEVAFNCKTCGKLFQKKENLFKHESLHKNGTRSIRGTKLECESCQKTFATVGHLRQHMKARHSVDDIEKTCGKLFQKEKLLKQESLDNNVTSQIRESRLECVPCGKTFATIGYLRKHRKAKHSVDVFDCKTCGKLFQKKENLLKHESLHKNGMTQERQTQIKCIPCGKTFTNLGHLRVHREQIHGCKICGKFIIRKENLSRHEALHTGKKGLFSGDELTCEYCGKRYSCRKSLKEHKQSFHEMGWIRGKQLNEKNFINRESLLNNRREWRCASCNKQFASKNRLRFHHLFAHKQDPSSGKTTGKLPQGKTRQEKLTKGEPTIGHKRNYDCNECGLRFSSRLGLSNHSRIHVNKKRHDSILRQCVKCKTHFKTSHSLRNHYRMYHPKLKSTLPKGYSADDRCLVCRLCFSNPYNLARHLRKNHPTLKILRCSVCPKVFVDVGHLTKHTAGHSKEGDTFNSSCNERGSRDSQSTKRSRFTCSICNKGFSSDFMMRLHKRSHYKAKPKQRYRCKICSGSFTNPVSLSLHSKRRCKRASSDTVQAIPADSCTYMASSSHKDDGIHENTSASGNPATGTHISHNTPGTLKKLDHRNDQAPDLCVPSKSPSRTIAKFICDICGKGFSSYLSVQCHRACHFRKTNLELSTKPTSPTTPMLGDENNNFPCALCNKSFRKRKSLSVHKAHHSRAVLHSKRGFSCSPGKVSSTRVPFMAAGEGFGCESCSKAFPTTLSLNAHKSHHSRQGTKDTKEMRRPAMQGLRCKVCGKTFKSKSSLITHKGHHSRNPYSCRHCSTCSFKTQSALEEHMQSCSKAVEDRRPYFCQYCHKRFWWRSGLYRHRRREHPEHAGSFKQIEKHYNVVDTFNEPRYETFVFQRKRFRTTGGRCEQTKVAGAEITPTPAQTKDVIGQQCGMALISESRCNRGTEITSVLRDFTGEEEQSSIKNKTSNRKHRNLKASWLDRNKQTANGFHCNYCYKGFPTMRSRYKHVMVVHAGDFGPHSTTSAHKPDSLCHPKEAPLDHYNSTQTTREKNQSFQGFSCDMKVSDKFKKRGNELIYVLARKLCKFCGKSFDSASGLYHHVQTVHSNQIGLHPDSVNFLHTPAITANGRTIEHNDFESMVRPESSSSGQHLGDPVNAAVTSRVPRCKVRQCELCLRNFSTVWNRNKHVKTVHKLNHDKLINNKAKTQRSELQSTLCNSTHTIRDEISSSIKSGGPGLKAFQCERCGKGFFTLNSRYKHFMLAHSKVQTSHSQQGTVDLISKSTTTHAQVHVISNVEY